MDPDDPINVFVSKRMEEKVDEILIPMDETTDLRPKLERPIASP
jgi:hypothetical protein